jgi:hypothetical protein
MLRKNVIVTGFCLPRGAAVKAVHDRRNAVFRRKPYTHEYIHSPCPETAVAVSSRGWDAIAPGAAKAATGHIGQYDTPLNCKRL